MKIQEVADRSGFSPPTLRYYEEIGLLPEPARTPSGYRTYDERTLERLAYIARAKQLGCSLGEIADLITAWEGGRCGPIQDRLRALVAAKLDTTREQIVGLSALSRELQHAAEALERHRPDGACDDRCGCTTDTTTDPTNQSDLGQVPTACTLRPDALRGQLDDWRALLAHTAARSTLDEGLRLDFAEDVPVDELMRLVTLEQDCCQFLRFAVTVDSRGIGLEVRGPSEARGAIETLFGAPVRIVRARREIAASTAVIFELIADPARQPAWDANDNLGAAPTGQRIGGVGEVFTTTLTGGSIRHNHVVEFVEGRRIAWRPSEPGCAPPGHLWRWELEPVDGPPASPTTVVTHTYDWSGLTDEGRFERARWTTVERLRASMDRLAALAEQAVH